MTNKIPHIVVFSGAGMSAESGLKTFRDNGGLWENHEVTEVATPEAWRKDKAMVLRFYNMRRKQLFKSQPNAAHLAVAALEKKHKVTVITQNVDDLHERAGSSKVLHLHGELKKVQSEKYPKLVYDWEKEEIELGDVCEKGHQLRPNVVWFGEAVPMMEMAFATAQTADIFIVIGTSLNVYPAASLVDAVRPGAQCYLIDPKTTLQKEGWTILQTTAGEGMKAIFKKLS
jgi:NAD-dependent deacetylase